MGLSENGDFHDLILFYSIVTSLVRIAMNRFV